jgi:glycosyltransferase
MKVTVITVSFNSAVTITDTLLSVAAQTYPHIEYLVIDGASTDNTVEIVKEFGTRVARLISEPDNGIYDAMNKGLAMATGDLVGFLNADDLYADPGVVASIVEAARRSGAQALFGDLVYVRANNLQSTVRLWRSKPFESGGLRFGWMPPHPTLYVQRQTMNALGGFNTTYRIAADYDFVLRCFGCRRMVTCYIPEVLVKMRLGGASNKSLQALWSKSLEDLRAIRTHKVGGLLTLVCKNVRKLPQFFQRSPRASNTD